MIAEWVIAAFNENVSIPLAVFHADWASHDKGTGRVELFKNRQLVDVVTLKPSQRLIALPINF
jgi:hypothetical protein